MLLRLYAPMEPWFPLPILAPPAIGAALMTQALHPHDVATQAVIAAGCAAFCLIAHLGFARRSVFAPEEARPQIVILPPTR